MSNPRNFLWSLFAKGLDFLTFILGMRAAQTKTPIDDIIVAMVNTIGDKFIPGSVSDDGLDWIDVPAITKESKGTIVKTVSAVTFKELLLMPEFRAKAKLDDMQADRLLIAALTFLKPDAVDTPEEIQAILDGIKPEVIIAS